MTVVRGDHELRAHAQRHEVAPQRDVERRRRLLQVHVIRIQRVFRQHPLDLVVDRRVGHRDALRTARRPRREDHVRRMRRHHRTHEFLRANRAVVEAAEIQRVHGECPDVIGQRGRVRAGRHDAEGASGVQDVGDAFGRMIRIQRHISPTRRHDRIHPHHKIQRTPNRQPHQRLRTHTLRNQQPRQTIHPRIEPTIRKLHTLVGDGDLVRMRLDGPAITIEQQFGAHRVAGVVPLVQDAIPLDHVEQVDTAQRAIGIGRDRAQQPVQAPRELGDRTLVEQIGGIGEHGGQARVRTLLRRHRQLKIEFGHRAVEFDRADRQAGQLELRSVHVLEEQRHLEQRVMRLRAHRIEYLDQPLERQFGVRERGQVAFLRRLQQPGERGRRVHRGPQHQRVDEHADQIVEFRLATSGDRRADGDVGGAGQSSQQRREGGVHHHEQRCAVGLREFVEPGPGGCVDGEGEDAAAPGGRGGARPIHGEVEPIGNARESVTPEGDLRRGHGAGVALLAEHGVLPQRVVRVLHRQRGPAGRLARAARDIGGHQVAYQRRYGRTVGRDVVHDHGEHVIIGADPRERKPQRHLGRDVEAGCGEGAQPVRQFSGGQAVRRQVRDRLLGGQHDLVTGTVHRRIHRPQRLMTLDHIRDRRLQRRHIQHTRQPHRERNIIRRRPGIELIQKPHPPLRQRQRHPLRTLRRHQRWTRRTGVEFGEAGGQPRDRRRFEHRPRGHPRADRRPEPGRDLRRDQRIAAQLEEIVVRADLVTRAEQVSEDARDQLLQRSRRGAEFLGLQLRSGQGTTIQLAHRGQRDLIQHGERGRHHMHRQAALGMRDQLVGVDGASARRVHIRRENRRAAVQLMPDGDREVDRLVRGQHRVDLAQLDTETANLHLEVVAAHVFQLAVRRPAHQVTGAVEPGVVRVERIRNETHGGEAGAQLVTARQLGSTDVQLADHADRDRHQPLVQHVFGGRLDRRADGHRFPGHQRRADVRHDRGLGRAVPVVQLALALGDRAHPAPHQLRRARLTTGHHHTQLVQPGRIHRGERGGGDERVGDGLPAQECRQLVTAVDRRRDHDHGRRPAQREQQFQHRCVERRRREMQRPRRTRHPIPITLLGAEARQTRLGDHHALRHAGGAGGVDDVGGMLGAQLPQPIRVGDRLGRVVLQLLDEGVRIDDQPFDFARQVLHHARDRQAEHRAGVLHHVLDTIGRIVRIHRHETRTGLGHRPHRDHRLHRTRNTHRDQILRTHPPIDEQPRQPRGPGVEFRVGEVSARADRVGEDNRGPGRMRFDGGCHQLREGSDSRSPGTSGPHPRGPRHASPASCFLGTDPCAGRLFPDKRNMKTLHILPVRTRP
ncbi:hypothetical protein NG2371_07074 [Nocardia gamkensis]|nr:hypothetical protein [Nocardia gamkensis]